MIILLLAAVMLLSSCQSAQIRTVVMDTKMLVPNLEGEDGTVREIHSFPTTTQMDGKNVSTAVFGWTDDASLLGETEIADSAYFGTIAGDTGDLSLLEGSGHQTMLGLSQNGRYLVYRKSIKGIADGKAPVIQLPVKNNSVDAVMVLYDTKTRQSLALLELGSGVSLRPASVTFSRDGKTLCFLADLFQDTADRLTMFCYDFESRQTKSYTVDRMLAERGYVYSLHVTEKSGDAWGGWIFLYDKEYGGLGNALRVKLVSGEALLDTDKDVINLLASAAAVQSWKGLNLGEGSVPLAQRVHWYDKTLLMQTGDQKLVAIDLAAGSALVLAQNVKSVAVTPDGNRVALNIVSSAGSEIYTARVSINAKGAVLLANVRIAFTGRTVSLGFWNMAGDKVVITETDGKDNKTYYRVLTIHAE
jgi:uncharacterized protein YcfL